MLIIIMPISVNASLSCWYGQYYFSFEALKLLFFIQFIHTQKTRAQCSAKCVCVL